jgi:hypothetical protein
MKTFDLSARIAHDVGLAAWFGGTLMGATALNQAVTQSSPDDHKEAGAATNAAWAKWTPVNAAAIALHLLGGAGLMTANKGRTMTQRGVAGMSTYKLGLTAAALGASLYSRSLGQKLIDTGTAVEGDTQSVGHQESSSVQTAKERLHLLQWVVPATTGCIVALSAYMGEQQRPLAIAKGMLERIHIAA